MVHISGQAAPDGDIDGVRPVKQQRGKRTRDRLLAAGQKLIRGRAFEALSVADIARAADCSVGAFYLRFSDKEAFFRALIAQYVAEGRAATLAAFATYDDDRLIAALVLSTAERFRRFTGLIRSAISKRMIDPSIWEPIRSNGHFTASRFIEWRTKRQGRPLTADEEMTVRFAFQVLLGTLNNALVNQPGPLDIEDPDFLVQLERAFRLVLLSPLKPPGVS
jgi:AcrR family transcriptional regulator